MVPPCINKYYILDLQPDNSVVRYIWLSQGHTVFLVSWKNPDASMSKVTWDDYVGKGVIKAIEVVKDIGGTKQINILGILCWRHFNKSLPWQYWRRAKKHPCPQA